VDDRKLPVGPDVEYSEDEGCNPSRNEHFSTVLQQAALSRRSFMQGSLSAAALGFLGLPLLDRAGSAYAATGPLIGFESVAPSVLDAVAVPPGYVVDVLYSWGDAIGAPGRPPGQPAFALDASNSADEQALQSGMHHDGMHFFPLSEGGKPSSRRGVLCINHEYTDQGLLYPDGFANWTVPEIGAEKLRKSLNAHGVSVIEVRRSPATGQWEVKRPSPYARRITGLTPIALSGPAAGHPLVQTAADPTGRLVYGTLNNCAHGYTPWGTYLACEENFNGYFANPTSDVVGVPSGDQKLEILQGQSRYGITRTGFGYRWHEVDPRFDASIVPNEPNRYGWVVEIDPMDPASTPVKRTALGRIKHEGAVYALAKDGRVVVYMGDDERNEYVYKFVTRRPWTPGDRRANADLLDEGTLYVAKFEAGGTTGDGLGTGRWLPIVWSPQGPAPDPVSGVVSGPLGPQSGFASAGEMLVKTRQAADRLGATMMDRPEWIAVHPHTGEVYMTLTNNSRRGSATPPTSNRPDGTTSADSARPAVDDANPRPANIFGHIVRWRERGGDAAATRFEWDIFVQAGNGDGASASNQGNITTVNPANEDYFGSPDGLWIDNDGRLWIQTDVSTGALYFGAYAAIGNNQMLCADPVSKRIKRFLVGPKGCEVTGVVTTPDGRTMFVNIQHPGEPYRLAATDPTPPETNDPAAPRRFSNWPDFDPEGRPRSATLVIRKLDGGVIGT
jgi:secreted PhoX family phosphatase